MQIKNIVTLLAVALCFAGCGKGPDNPQPVAETEHYLIFRFHFDSTQERLGNMGQVAAMPAGHWGQSPRFNVIGAHYFELASNAYTQLGQGAVLYKGPQTTAGGSDAIDFDQLTLVHDGEVALKVPLKSIAAGNYQYLRVSLAYQNYGVDFNYANVGYSGTLASFIGFNSYLRSYHIKDSLVTVNANKAQGYYGFETIYNVTTGDGAGVTTVVNPIAATSPIPAGSCVVTAEFPGTLQVTGNEQADINVSLSLSTNQSFEWEDLNGNHKWDVDQGEHVVDMGIRGMKLYRVMQ